MMLGFDPASLESDSAEAAAALALRAAVISRTGINRFLVVRFQRAVRHEKLNPSFEEFI